MRLIGDTLTHFIRSKRIQKAIFIISFTFLVLVVLDFYIPFLSVSLSFVVEIFAVFIGIYLGFDFNRYMENRRLARETRKILFLFIDELEENRKNMDTLYSSATMHYTAFMLKSSIWDVYKEKLGDAGTKNVDTLADFYYNINLINDNIKYVALPSAHPQRTHIRKIIIKTNKKIGEWIKTTTEYYEKVDNPPENKKGT